MTCYRLVRAQPKRTVPVKKWRKNKQWLHSLLNFIGVDGNIISL